MRLGFFIALALVAPSLASAQNFAGLGSTSGEMFSVSVSPQYPSPHTRATLTFVSDSVELSNSTLAVVVDNKEIYRGAVRPVSVPLGAAGVVSTIKVTITSGGASSSQTLALAPQDVTLVVEPLSSAPPLYLGKPSIPLEGSVRVVAVASLHTPKGTSSNPSTYGYAWTVDGVRVANSSGVGKSSILVASPLQYRSRDVSVAVTSSDGALAGGASYSLSALEPTVRLYENDPLLGIRFGHALSGNYALAGAESTLYAAPFSLSTNAGAPRIEWFLNGSSAQVGPSITLRPTGSGQGSATLSLTASSGGLSSALASLSVAFGSKSTNFFGL